MKSTDKKPVVNAPAPQPKISPAPAKESSGDKEFDRLIDIFLKKPVPAK